MICITILKTDFFAPGDIITVHNTYPLLSNLHSACMLLDTYNFLWLSEYNPDWATQTKLSETKSYAFLACLLHYNLSVVNVVHFLGNNYTGAYHDITSITMQLQNLGLNETLIT